MSTDSLRGTAAIVGIGLGGLGEAPGRTAMEILAESAYMALADAGLKTTDVDGLFASSSFHALPNVSVGEYLGIKPRHTDGTMMGGSSLLNHLLSASLALKEGLCDVALVCYGSHQRTGFGKLTAGSQAEPRVYEAPYKPKNPVTSYALAAARHMHQYGTTREQLASVAVAARKWAALNPAAFMRDPLTLADVLGARMISDPLTVRDCCLVTDGGGAVVLVRSERARDFPKPPAYVLGVAGAHWHWQIGSMPDLTVTSATDTGQRAFAMAGLGPRDVDVVQLYDAFTINTVLFLEDLGFCAKGEGGALVASGAIAPGGRLPVNTNGGGLSFGHPGMYGIFTIIEAVEQIRGSAGARQVDGVDVALCHGNGAVLSSQVSAVLGSAATV